jgi:hypothetical protein
MSATSDMHTLPDLVTVEVSKRPWVRVQVFDEGEYCAEGLKQRGSADVSVPWSAMRRVAWGYQIHPIYIADWDFWAFQTSEPGVTYWIYVRPSSPISTEIERRFAVGKIPPMRDWADREMNTRAFVVWPPADRGRPMYLPVKRHPWSWRTKLAYSTEWQDDGGLT